PEGDGGAVVLGVSARGEAEDVALLMFRHLARAAGHDVLLGEGGGPSAGLVSVVQQRHAALVLLASLAPGGLTEACYLCRRLRSQVPALRIVVGRWGHRRDPKRARELLLSAGADWVATSLREANGQVTKFSRDA